MIKHIVMWKMKEFADGRDKNSNIKILKDLLENLPSKITGIDSLEVGVNITSDPSAYDVVLVAYFKDRNKLESYSNHPEHVKVKEFLSEVRISKAVADFEST